MKRDKHMEPSEEQIKRTLEAHDPRRIEPGELKIAAVLVPIFEKEGAWHVLLTRRTQRVGHHKGEISFPGGHRDPEDPDLVGTVLREAEEEVGLAPAEVRILGRLDDISTITGFRIRPFVGVIPYPFNQRPAPAEIAEIFTLPLARFLAPDNFIRREFTKDGRPYPVYYFDIGGYNVWGATAKIMVQFLELAMNFKQPSK